MDENDFRASLRVAVMDSDAPPTMRVADAIRAGRRAGRPRLVAATVAGVAALAVLTGGAVVATNRIGEPHYGNADPTAGLDAKPSVQASASARPQDETAKLLLDRLTATAPAGWTVTDPGQAKDLPQDPAAIASIAGQHDGQDVWQYSINIELKRNGLTKLFMVEVHLPGLIPAGTKGCDLTRVFWLADKTSGCRQVRVGDLNLPIMDNPKHSRIEQWSAYRHPDGVVVVFAQVAPAAGPGQEHTGSPSLPLTEIQLAALTMDERFHVTR